MIFNRLIYAVIFSIFLGVDVHLCFFVLLRLMSHIVYFLADRTNGGAIGTVLRLSSSVVCNATYCG